MLVQGNPHLGPTSRPSSSYSTFDDGLLSPGGPRTRSRSNSRVNDPEGDVRLSSKEASSRYYPSSEFTDGDNRSAYKKPFVYTRLEVSGNCILRVLFFQKAYILMLSLFTELEASTRMFGQLADPNGANNALSQVLYGLALR